MKSYAAAKIIVQHPEKNKILLVKRHINDKIHYEAAGGRIDIDFEKKLSENFEQCAIREAKEELGISVQALEYVGSYYFFWLIKKDTCSICTVFLTKTECPDVLETKSDAEHCNVSPEWVDVRDILHNKVLFGEHHIGLQDIVKKAALRMVS